MSVLWFDAEADNALATLESDPGRHALHQGIKRVLDQLEQDPGHHSVRRRRFHEVGLWCVLVSGDDEEWAVLWEPHPEPAHEVVVQYLGPASFA